MNWTKIHTLFLNILPMRKKLLPFEHTSKPLLDVKTFRTRQLIFMLYASLLILFSLGIGMAGYAYFMDMDLIRSFYNASMILTGMGPAEPVTEPAAQIFAGAYSLFSGVVFLSTVAVMFAPVIHRFMHKMHIEEPE